MNRDEFNFEREAWWRDYCRDFLRKKGLGPPGTQDGAIGRVQSDKGMKKQEMTRAQMLAQLETK